MLARYMKLAAYIILILAFFYLFGYDNILRYLRGGVTVVKYDETVEGMPPPGIIYILHITIYDVNQDILL